MRRRNLLALPLCGLLAMCATMPATKTVCLPLKPYTAAEQDQASAELQALPPGSFITQMVGDYGAMRAADRACQAAKPSS